MDDCGLVPKRKRNFQPKLQNEYSMNYKLLVLDVDGTLLNSKHEISRRTLSTLLKVQQMGIRIVLASGRPPHGLTNIVRQLEMPLYGGYGLQRKPNHRCSFGRSDV